MKNVLKITIMLMSISLLAPTTWADGDELSALLNSKQFQASSSLTATYTQQNQTLSKALVAIEPDEADLFISNRTNDYQVVLVNDPIGGILEEEKVFENGDTRLSVVTAAFNHLNVPYKYGGQNLSSGFDCSGLVMSIFQEVANKSLPRTAAAQAAATASIKRSELKPGDLVFFNTAGRRYSHVGIYVGDNQFIHAPRTGSQIRIDSINNNYWNKRFTGARRVISL